MKTNNTIIHIKDEFKLGIKEGVRLNDNRNLELIENIKEGYYISPEILTDEFNEAVASWNAIVNDNSSVEILIKARVNSVWSKWFSYGNWYYENNRGSIYNQNDDIAKLNIDTLNILNNQNANGIKYKIILKRSNEDLKGPELKLIAVTFNNITDKKEKLLKNDFFKILNVPQRSQMGIPKIGREICSPTSVSMVLEMYGVNLPTEEVAEKCKDYNANIYGNWSYAAAFAGSNNLYAYVEKYNDLNDIKEKISKNIPVICSVSTKEQNELEGSPQAYPSGHLLVVKGFKIINNVEYVVINDPAAPEENTIERLYKSEQFEKVWKKYVYIIRKEIN